MSNVKISDLSAASTPLTGAELVPIVQGGVTKRTTTGDVIAPLAADDGSSLVGFIQSSAGSIETTVQSKLRETISVFDFMTAAQIESVRARDLIEDVTVAIQDAIDSSTMVDIYFPSGTYKVTSTITIGNKKFLRGAQTGSMHNQPAIIYHDPSATGPAFAISTTSAGGSSIRNLQIYGGSNNYSSPEYAVTVYGPFVHLENVLCEPYSGNGFHLMSDASEGSWCSKLVNCRWVGPGPNIATPYKGLVIDVWGGDVEIIGFNSTYGAIGIEVIRGQTVYIQNSNVNRVTRLPSEVTSSASQFETCGIRLTGTDPATQNKQSITIKNCYLENCDNSIYAEACESLSIEDNWIDSRGTAGRIGAWYPVGNSLINLAGSTCKNVTIKNNNLYTLSNGNATDPFYLVRCTAPENLLMFNNSFYGGGSQPSYYNIQNSSTVWLLGNSFNAVSTLQPNVTTGSVITDLGTNWTTKTAVTYQNSWVDYDASSTVTYRKDAFGMVTISGVAKNGTIPANIFQLPSGYRPAQQQGFITYSGATYARLWVTTTGQVYIVSGDPAYVYLNMNFKIN